MASATVDSKAIPKTGEEGVVPKHETKDQKENKAKTMSTVTELLKRKADLSSQCCALNDELKKSLQKICRRCGATTDTRSLCGGCWQDRENDEYESDSELHQSIGVRLAIEYQRSDLALEMLEICFGPE